ncbi:MAG: nucleotidyltransferase family protein [Chloroflexi bacterium]|nr:nucleotidyltransferase family protein [Chloroflexota bacterium]
MSVDDLLTANRREILGIAARHGVRSIQVFGSFARGDAGADSDVDFLIEVEEPVSPWFPGGLVADLEDLLGRRVDVVTHNGLHSSLRDRVLQEARPL